ncbi:accessory gene regulator AgrB [Staphylococcus shinii]|uniref:accessory gene regulator AgrB n=1 Tax=Staphylococcus shinii TaxID=2912228 RepID=UPI000852F603|nr:accessory gene regulator AgrB [Staphylococcus shinii]MBO3066510.1 accessory gene regulator AgrB [Staphylococcus shinii]OEK86100.1 accessory regulator AgrB [Staphylococcus shinii]PKI11833.1 accessory regulator AgrB [Staphylococcus shinii]QRA17563.1 accessory gene regulator AgrB [Staphylococcus shinii]
MSKLIDTKIDNFAKSLQLRNNLDHIEYLKMRLGMQVVVNNFFKTTVIYGVSILCHLFLYTLTVHLSFLLIRVSAHGAHATSSLFCYIQSLVIFVLLPAIIGYYQVSSVLLYPLAIIGFIILATFAPTATKKQPIPERLKKSKKIKTIISTALLLLLSLFFETPYQQFILIGIVIVSCYQLPTILLKEDV